MNSSLGRGRVGETPGIKVADVRPQVELSLFEDFEDFSEFKPRGFHEKKLHEVFDAVVSWGGALRTVRSQDRREIPAR